MVGRPLKMKKRYVLIAARGEGGEQSKHALGVQYKKPSAYVNWAERMEQTEHYGHFLSKQI
jgi:hypothetical protein